jgi:hypothetical protein
MVHHTGLHLVNIFVSDYIFHDYFVNITCNYVFLGHPTYAVDFFNSTLTTCCAIQSAGVTTNGYTYSHILFIIVVFKVSQYVVYAMDIFY